MPRTCTICTHPERAAIDQALVAGRSAYDLAAAYGVSHDAVTRHNASHLSEHLAKARHDADIQQALDITKQLRAINAVSLNILDEARRSNNPAIALKAIDRIQRQLELQGRLLGELDAPQVNVLLAPEWVSIRAGLLAALGPYPEARAAAAQQLLSMESSNGHR
jgi:DNA-binding transcriptional ArsR family regulator